MLRNNLWASLRAVSGVFHPARELLWALAPITWHKTQLSLPSPKRGLGEPLSTVLAQGFAWGRFPAPRRLTLCKDVLPELWREVGGRQAQVGGSQLQDLCLEHVPDLGSLLQSWVLEHLQQEGSAIFDLQEAVEAEKSLFVVQGASEAKVGSSQQQED